MNLIIVESPTKARTLSRFLGRDYDVEATMGHIKDLPKSELGVDIKHEFKPQYQLILKNADVVKKIISDAKKAGKVYLATDPDREGEAIAQHVSEVLRSNLKLKRITFHEITENAVKEAIEHPRDIDRNLVDAQIARRVLDRLVGYKLSPLLWRKVRRGLSAGRVQTVAVRLIVEREREIEAFKPEEYWEIFCQVKSQKSKVKSEFIVQLIKVGEKKAEIKDGKTAKEIVGDLEKANYKVLDVNKREVVKNPYAPFTTSTMTQAGARLFGWSAKKTMSTAQRLYEEGLITYHRTDSTNIAQSAIEKARTFIKKEYGDKYLPASFRIYKTTSKVAQEAHEAVRPTRVEVISNKEEVISLGNDAKKLYELIWRRFVACQMNASIYDETTIDIEALGTRKLGTSAQSLMPNAYLLRASGQTLKFDGWTRLRLGSAGQGKDEIIFPDVQRDEPLQLIKVEPQQKFTEPSVRYNEASLIKTLEKLGIGRPSTYAPIISTIQVRQYVEKKEGKFFPTPVGTAVNDFLIKYFPDVFEYAFTAEMEDSLDKIANGEGKWTNLISKFWNPFNKKLESVTENSKSKN